MFLFCSVVIVIQSSGLEDVFVQWNDELICTYGGCSTFVEFLLEVLALGELFDAEIMAIRRCQTLRTQIPADFAVALILEVDAKSVNCKVMWKRELCIFIGC
jgi:hypothetical protein